ncbi:hypothetical protein Micbo1qcDRAFT_156751, partial [Microdochium bolleyi]
MRRYCCGRKRAASRKVLSGRARTNVAARCNVPWAMAATCSLLKVAEPGRLGRRCRGSSGELAAPTWSGRLAVRRRADGQERTKEANLLGKESWPRP